MSNEQVRLAAVGDIHCDRKSQGKLRPLFARMAEKADVLVLCGDLTDYGLEEEAVILATELEPAMNRAVIAVLGNHDFQAGKEERIHRVLVDAGVTVLDGDSCEIKGVGFAGVKGFGGGFSGRALEPWGEPALKHFVREAVEESLKLEAALTHLSSSRRVVILHYAPIRETVVGEELELYPFLGSVRLEETLNRYPVTAVLHGHAHFGAAEGKTSSGIPVYNVALPLLARTFPGSPPFRLLDL